MADDTQRNDFAWSSRGMAPAEAFRVWCQWACEALTPMEIEVPDQRRFSAQWQRRHLGPIDAFQLRAGSQRVRHLSRQAPGRNPTFQLVYCRETPIQTRVCSQRFVVQPGEFVLLDNSRPYEMTMDAVHSVTDLVMPRDWLERWLPDTQQFAGRPYSAATRWGLPLGSYLSVLVDQIEQAALPRPALADQVGSLLALAVGHPAPTISRHKEFLVQRILGILEERYMEPGLSAAEVGESMGISKRYLHALLASVDTTFLDSLTRIRLDRAAGLLMDRRAGRLPIAEIAWRCGYPDPGYFARVFRKHFGLSPVQWRRHRQSC